MTGFSTKLQAAAAGNVGAELYISPASGNYTVGDTIVFTIRENSHAATVDGVQANLTYPTSTLRFLSASTATSAFTTTVQNTGGGGTVQIGVGLLGSSTTGDQIVATVSFRVVGSGSANVSFAAGSMVTSAVTAADICRSKTGSSVTLAATSGPKLYLTPASGSYVVGNNIVMAIREDSLASTVDGVQANLTYPTAQLQYVSTSLTGTAFTTTIQNTGGSGSIQLGLGLLGSSVSGDQLVGTITFTVLAAGAAEVSFAAGSILTSAVDSSDVAQYRLSAFYDLT